MYPPNGTSTPPAAAPAPQPMPAQASPPGSGSGAQAPGSGSPGAAPPAQPQTLIDRLTLAQAAVDAAQSPALDGQPTAAIPVPTVAQQPQATPAPAVQPAPVAAPPVAGAAAAESPELVQARNQLAIAQQQLARVQQEAAAIQNWAAIGYQTYQQQQAAARAPQVPAGAPAQQSITGVPQFDRGLLQWVTTDADGNRSLKPGAPPDVLHRLRDYETKVEQFYHNFSQDPLSILGPEIDKRIETRAAALAQATITRSQAERETASYIEANARHFYEHDASGRRLMDSFNRPVLTGVGQRFVQVSNALDAGGIKDPTLQRQLTEQIVLGQLAVERMQQGGLPAIGQQPPTQQIPVNPQPPPQYGTPMPQQPQQGYQGQQPQQYQQPALVPQTVNPLAVLAAAQRQQFVQQQGAAAQQVPGGPATPPSVPAMPYQTPAGVMPDLQKYLAAAAQNAGFDMSEVMGVR